MRTMAKTFVAEKEDDLLKGKGVDNVAETANPTDSASPAELEDDKEVKVKEESVKNTKKEATVVSGVKKVKIRSREDFSCTIAHEKYSFEIGKEYVVPADVAAILVNGDKAFRV